MTKKIKISIWCIFLLVYGNSLQAQKTIASGGGTFSGSGGSVSFTVGETAVSYVAMSSGAVQQGVQQPFKIAMVGADDLRGIELSALVYPNPTAANVQLDIKEQSLEDLSFELFDTEGRLLIQEKITSTSTIIHLENLASAAYFLKIKNSKTILKTFSIVKNL